MKGRLITYVDVEVGVIDINAVHGLAETDVANTRVANVVVINEAELHVWHGLLDQLSSYLDVGALAERSNARLLPHLIVAGVAGSVGNAELIQVDGSGSASETGGCRGLRVCEHMERQAEKPGGKQEAVHVDQKSIYKRGSVSLRISSSRIHTPWVSSQTSFLGRGSAGSYIC